MKCNHSEFQTPKYSLNVGKFQGFFNGLHEFGAMLEMMHLFLNLRVENVAKRSLSQKL